MTNKVYAYMHTDLNSEMIQIHELIALNLDIIFMPGSIIAKFEFE